MGWVRVGEGEGKEKTLTHTHPQDLDPTVKFFRLAGTLYNPLKKEEEDKEQLNDVDIENEEAEDNDFN